MTDAKTNASLQDVSDYVQADSFLSDSRRRDLTSALSRVAVWLGYPLDCIQTDRQLLRDRLAELNPSQLGIEEKTFANIRSNVDAALTLAFDGGVLKQKTPLTENWQAVLGLFSADQNWRMFKLQQLANWCAGQGIEPDDVNAETFDDWLAWRIKYAPLARKPARAVEDAKRVWNWCCNNLEGWLFEPVAVVKRRKEVAIPLDQFPALLRSEFESYRQAATTQSNNAEPNATYEAILLAGPDVCGEALQTIKPKSKRVVDRHLDAVRFCATSLVQHKKRQLEDLTSISSIVTPSAVALTVQDVKDRNEKVTEYSHTLVKDLMVIAKQWLKVDEREIEAYRRLLDILSAEAELDGRLSLTNRKRLAQFKNPQNIVRLVSLPQKIIAEMEAERIKTKRVTLKMACDARTAIAIAILIALPVRRANLVSTGIGRQLILPLGKSDHAVLEFASHEVKNKRPIGRPLSAETRDLLEIYIKHYRSVLVGMSGSANAVPLLITQKGTAMSGQNLYADIKRIVREKTGLDITVHFFRHLMGALLLKASKGNYDLVRALLGHEKGSRTTELYVEIEAAMAADALDEAVAKQLKPAKRRKFVQRQWKRDAGRLS